MNGAAARAVAASLFTTSGCSGVRFYENASAVEFSWGPVKAAIGLEILVSEPPDVLAAGLRAAKAANDRVWCERCAAAGLADMAPIPKALLDAQPVTLVGRGGAV